MQKQANKAVVVSQIKPLRNLTVTIITVTMPSRGKMIPTFFKKKKLVDDLYSLRLKKKKTNYGFVSNV